MRASESKTQNVRAHWVPELITQIHPITRSQPFCIPYLSNVNIEDTLPPQNEKKSFRSGHGPSSSVVSCPIVIRIGLIQSTPSTINKTDVIVVHPVFRFRANRAVEPLLSLLPLDLGERVESRLGNPVLRWGAHAFEIIQSESTSFAFVRMRVGSLTKRQGRR